MDERVRTYALLALLVFVVGGLLAPLTHDLAHAFAGQDHPPAHVQSTEAIAPSSHAEAYDCELCEVLLSATTITQKEVSSVFPLEDRVSFTSAEFSSDKVISAQSRAPPYLLI